MADIELPALGESVTEGTITRWFKAVGEEVAEDEPLFEVSTDKVDSEVPSPVAGIVTEILVEEGDTVDVGTRVAVVSSSAGGDAAPAAPAAEAPPAPQYEPLPEPLPGAAEPARPEVLPEPLPTAGAPAHEPLPEPLPVAAAPSAPAPPEPLPSVPAPTLVPPAPAPVAPAASGAPALLSPVVRRLLDDAGIDPTQVAGSGLGGRITRADAEAHIRAQASGAVPAAPAAPSTK